MAINVKLKEIEEGILTPLTEILLMCYGTDMYRQILLSLERIIKDLEKRQAKEIFWQ